MVAIAVANSQRDRTVRKPTRDRLATGPARPACAAKGAADCDEAGGGGDGANSSRAPTARIAKSNLTFRARHDRPAHRASRTQAVEYTTPTAVGFRTEPTTAITATKRHDAKPQSTAHAPARRHCMRRSTSRLQPCLPRSDACSGARSSHDRRASLPRARGGGRAARVLRGAGGRSPKPRVTGSGDRGGSGTPQRRPATATAPGDRGDSGDRRGSGTELATIDTDGGSCEPAGEGAPADAPGQSEWVGSVTALRQREPNQFVITLDSGEVWQQRGADRYPLRVGQKVRIYQTRFGTRLQADGVNGFIHVFRVP